jgi:hypothetical protein
LYVFLSMRRGMRISFFKRGRLATQNSLR